jgi:aminoglycoside phosphotransferase (APT) family kinase protein
VAAGAPQLRVPDVLADGADAELPFVVTRWVDGKPASSFLATPADAMGAATRLHAVLGELSRLPPAPPDLSTVWADPELLQRAAVQWLAGVSDRLDPRVADVVADCVERTRTALDFDSPVFAHGDVVPVNVLIDERGEVTLLDYEDARLAIRAFDRAMLWTTLAIHHPAAAAAFESLIARLGSATSSSVDRFGLATTGCLQRLERASESLAGLGDEAAALGELARAAQLVCRSARAD